MARGDKHQVIVDQELKGFLHREEWDLQLACKLRRVDQRARGQFEGRDPSANQLVGVPCIHSLASGKRVSGLYDA
jgi:hypothetical protein